MTISSMIK